MIKVNLIPVKRKKKAKPVPAFLIIGILVTLVALFISGFLYFRAATNLSAKEKQFADNKNRLNALKEKIKEVENFEQLNKTFEKRSEIIEQLSKNKSVPVILLDEASKLLPTGVWLDTMIVSGSTVKVSGFGFSNAEIVTYVNNIKASQLFTDAYLQQTRSTEVEKVPVYQFQLSFRIKV